MDAAIAWIGVLAMAWPVVALVAIGSIYLWRFVTRRKETKLLISELQTQDRAPLGRFHNRRTKTNG